MTHKCTSCTEFCCLWCFTVYWFLNPVIWGWNPSRFSFLPGRWLFLPRMMDLLEGPSDILSAVLVQKYLPWLHNWLLIEFCSHSNLFACILFKILYLCFCLCKAVVSKNPDFRFMSPIFFLYLMYLLLRGQPKHHFPSVHVSYCEYWFGALL